MKPARCCIGVCTAATLCGSAYAAGEELKQTPFGPGGSTALLSAFEGKSDFKIRVHAPEEDTEDVLEALDSLLRIEQAERRADEDDYVSEKQRLLNIQKNRIRDIVQAAFEPIHAMIPNPVRAEVERSKLTRVALCTAGAVKQ
uniref:Secreted protein n=1 Tax=Toxoplasma gondii (strain ATCC 50861 / VEG) TaxID=432359 RepID=A0A0F7UV72_TOXGV|nr:TPA: hypothetical protein BN1205_058120 [Toxoplasma gondii VEG]